MTKNGPNEGNASEDFYGPVDEPDFLLGLHEQWKEFLAPGNVLPVKSGKRGRPRKEGPSSILISEISPRQLSREDLVEVAQNWNAVVAHVRSDRLNSARPIRAALARISSAANDRAHRVAMIASILKNPINSSWSRHPNSKLAMRIGGLKEFLAVTPDTLRKDIAKAKKLNWHATHSD
jgi:hypothetical protein